MSGSAVIGSGEEVTTVGRKATGMRADKVVPINQEIGKTITMAINGRKAAGNNGQLMTC
jgi:hypothetical protein